MFVHGVLFEVRPKEFSSYRKDSLMWARCAKKAKGFLSYRTVARVGHKHQYASVYQWKTKADHDRFMRKHHDSLVRKSKAEVTVKGYYNLRTIDRVK